MSRIIVLACVWILQMVFVQALALDASSRGNHFTTFVACVPFDEATNAPSIPGELALAAIADLEPLSISNEPKLGLDIRIRSADNLQQVGSRMKLVRDRLTLRSKVTFSFSRFSIYWVDPDNSMMLERLALKSGLDPCDDNIAVHIAFEGSTTHPACTGSKRYCRFVCTNESCAIINGR